MMNDQKLKVLLLSKIYILNFSLSGISNEGNSHTHTLLEVVIFIKFLFNIYTCVKNGYVASTENAGLSYKEKALKHSRGRNFD